MSIWRDRKNVNQLFEFKLSQTHFYPFENQLHEVIYSLNVIVLVAVNKAFEKYMYHFWMDMSKEMDLLRVC